jgi:hypothetical protein
VSAFYGPYPKAGHFDALLFLRLGICWEMGRYGLATECLAALNKLVMKKLGHYLSYDGD